LVTLFFVVGNQLVPFVMHRRVLAVGFAQEFADWVNITALS